MIAQAVSLVTYALIKLVILLYVLLDSIVQLEVVLLYHALLVLTLTQFN
jgi:hypothetical protein